MWLIVLLTLVNALANNKTFLEYRFNIGIAPINAIDALLVFGTFYALFRLKSSRNFASEKLHPAFLWAMGLMVAGGICGFIGTFSNEATAYEVLNVSRSYLTMPACILIGYALVPQLRSVRWVLVVHVVGGIFTAIMILAFFRTQLETGAGEKSINALREVNYISSYAGTAAIFLIFSLLVGVRFLPLILALPLAAFMIVGQFSTLSRSEWVASILGLLVSLLLLPRGRRARGIALSILAGIFLLVSLWVGVSMAAHSGDQTFGEKMETRLKTMIPGSDTAAKAWDTRVPASIVELKQWLNSPIYGQGFAKQAVIVRTDAAYGEGFNHNVWTAALCQMGVVGFAALMVPILICIVLGAKMVRSRVNRMTVIVGCLGVVSGFFYIIYGASTLSINTERGAIPLGITIGLVIRTRMMERATLALYGEYLTPNADEMSEIPVDHEGYILPYEQLEIAYEESYV